MKLELVTCEYSFLLFSKRKKKPKIKLLVYFFRLLENAQTKKLISFELSTFFFFSRLSAVTGYVTKFKEIEIEIESLLPLHTVEFDAETSKNESKGDG